MVLALLPLLFIAFILGFTAIEQDISSTLPPAAPLQMNAPNAAGQEFMLYHNAIITYAQQSLGAQNQPQPISQITLQNAVAAPVGAVAVITPNASPITSANLDTSSLYGPGYSVCVWMPAPAGTAAMLMNQIGQDLTIGTVAAGGTTWIPAVTAGSNSTAQPIPSGCLNPGYPVAQPQQGDIISVSGVGGN